ncbi:MAG: HTTM domain-containing protein [Saprospiraceae bacterium]|nr:HTTM domain-containing protein [Saprospiraceae bacterium]
MNNLFGQVWQAWDTLFFSEQPTLTLAVFRCLTGLLVLTDTWNWTKTYRLLLAPKGWLGQVTYDTHERNKYFSWLHFFPATTRAVQGLLAVQAGAALCLALGILPNLAALICFSTLVSIHHRNAYVLHSGDTVCRFFCLFLVFAPVAQQLSILHPAALLQPEDRGWPWTLVMVRLFVANIYLKNVWFKLQGAWWRDGTATQKVLGVHLWNRVPVPAFLDHNWFYRSTTYGTLVVETALFSLIWWEPLRWPVLIAGALFHLGLWYFLRVQLFQIAMLVGLATFVEAEEYLRFFAWLGLV